MSSLLTLVIFFAGCSMFMFLAVGAVLWVWFRRRSAVSPRPGKAGKVALPSPQTFVHEARSQLRPWSPQALGRLAARWRGEWAHGMGQVGTFLGQVLDVDEADGSGWLAFGASRPSPGRTELWLCTSSTCYHFRFSHNLFTMAGEGEIWVDGQRFGYLRLPSGIHTRGTVTLLDPDRRPVGQYRRRGRVWVSLGKLSTLSSGQAVAGRLTLFYGPVVLGERVLGHLVGTWVRLPTSEQRRRMARVYGPPVQPYPAFRHLREDLREDEVAWLLALVGLELALDVAVMDTKRIQDGGTGALVQRLALEDIEI